ncbi:MAG: phage holin family protein [Thermoproteota archaeon]|nr:phage holin family protein [Thermoproteota archaeon]
MDMKKASSYPLTTERLLKRLILTFFVETLSLLVITLIVPGVTIDDKPLIEAIYTIILAALVLGILNLLVRPFLIMITVSINTLILGISILLINALMLGLTSYLVPGFIVKDIGSALLGALALAGANTIFIRLAHLNEDSSFFATVLLRLIKKQQEEHQQREQQEMPDGKKQGRRGLVILEIDGLSYERMKRAAEIRIMRTVNEMLKNGTHKLSLFDCGLPSQTSACQAGILYGNNYDIPGFRWFDKNQGKMIVSNNFRDAAQLNARLGRANNNALLKDGGSSIINMFDGGASKTLFTLCAISGRKKNHDVMKRHRQQQQQDLYLVYLHPYFFTSTLTMTLWDIIVELCQGLRQIICNTQPRINRLKKGYPFCSSIDECINA